MSTKVLKNKNERSYFSSIVFVYFSIFQYDDSFTLDFERVPLGHKACLELTIRNLTDIETQIHATIEKFSTRVRGICFLFQIILFLFFSSL